ncbi:MAG: hypothetical protein U0269_32105 [Polyangiales bacterium]
MQWRLGMSVGVFAAMAACSPPVMPQNDAMTNNDASSTPDSSMPSGDAAACNEFGARVTPYQNMDMACDGFQATPCMDGDPEFCPRFRNNDMNSPKFVLTQLDIYQPSSLLPNSAVGRLLNTSVRNAAFSWGVALDLTANTIRTGTIRQPVARRVGTGYYAETLNFVMNEAPVMGMLTADRWNAVTAPVTVMGNTVGMPMGMTVPLITIPVYDETDRTMLLTELPLRDARISGLRLTANRNCIGTAFAMFNSCGPSNNRWNTSSDNTAMGTPNGVLEAKLTFEDTLNIQVVSLNMPLCNIIARSPCRDAMTNMPVNPASLTVPPDTTVMVGGMAKPAWTLRAFIAGVAANIAN